MAWTQLYYWEKILQDDTNKNNKELTDSAIKLIVSTLQSKKCEDITVLNLNTVNAFLSWFIIASVQSTTQAKSVSRELVKTLKSERIKNYNNQNDIESGWILLDFGDIFVHIMTPQTRNFYDLEKLWGDAKQIQI